MGYPQFKAIITDIEEDHLLEIYMRSKDYIIALHSSQSAGI